MDQGRRIASYSLSPEALVIVYLTCEDFFNKKKVEPQGTFKEMQRRGIRLTSYSEYDANGNEIRR